jgi:hypothetical protein
VKYLKNVYLLSIRCEAEFRPLTEQRLTEQRLTEQRLTEQRRPVHLESFFLGCYLDLCQRQILTQS